MPYVSKVRRQEIDALLAAGLKRCSRCRQVKLVGDFNVQPKDKTGLRPECRDCYHVANSASYQRNREARLQWQRAFNKTEERRRYNRGYQRDRQRRERENLAARPRPSACEVCGLVGPVFYDHDHSTGKRIGRFRGWLCCGCNTAIGYAREDAAILHRLADYLERDQVQHQHQVQKGVA